MGAFLKRSQATGLIVCLAIVLQLLAPAWASAARSTAGTPWAADVCRSSPAPDKTPAAAHSLKHCLFCSSGADTYAPPAAPAGLPALPAGAALYAGVAPAATACRTHWHPAQPRAPPALS
ncbi:DUF2946 domain-containing protein [Pseudoduganella sp. FT93W]|uniref:DUF2946 domain-containing protein n=1 Tax=Duganella fentianensis TaxID=2692177 RepID=A0A845I4Y9_9BURK|nr:DUF2946 family protein [Duganella fentianensis]MYN47467.1 DUF2946 domain-containing protein [Duganella fentianensis]